MKKKNGFTLIELVVVIALIAILAVTLAPRLRDQIAKAKDSKAIATLGSLRTLSEVYFADFEESPVVAAGLTNATVTDANSTQALDFLIPDLDPTAMKLIQDGGGTAEDGTWAQPTALGDGDSADGYRAAIGGQRTSQKGAVVYDGSVGFTFVDPSGVAATDGVQMWFTSTSTDADSNTYTFDTKGNNWASY